VAYAGEPKRLQARLAELRRMVAEFRRRPETYSMSALFHSDREANLRWLAKQPGPSLLRPEIQCFSGKPDNTSNTIRSAAPAASGQDRAQGDDEEGSAT
jgi:hypothetical protein